MGAGAAVDSSPDMEAVGGGRAAAEVWVSAMNAVEGGGVAADAGAGVDEGAGAGANAGVGVCV